MGDALHPLPRAAQQLPLMQQDASGALRAHKVDARSKSRYAGNVVCAGLQTVGQKVGHLLPQRVAARAALDERQRIRAAEQKSRPLRAVKPLVSRHGDKRRAERGKVERQDPCRL